MAENTEEEYLGSPGNTQPDNPSDDIISTQNTETINTNQETEKMEVHKHPHHITHKKKWGEYLLEFLMLFLAVFLGFVAENFREHQVEKEKEKQFIHSLIQDIKNDITQIDSLQINNKQSQKICDSLLVLFSGKEIITNSYPAYALWKSINGFTDFVPNDETIEQLKSSGTLRLIRKTEVVENLMEYYKITQLIKLHQSAMNLFLFQPTNKSDLFDIPRFDNTSERLNTPLLSDDKKQISKAYLNVSQWKGLLGALNNFLETERVKGKNLLNVINREYDLQRE